jgi:hypothetical protein
VSLRARVSDWGVAFLNRFARNHEYRLVPKPGPRAGQLYERWPLWTAGNHDFLIDPRFVRAYQRGVKATGWDYGIHWRVHVALWAADQAARIPGDFVECGVGRGMVSSAVLEWLDWDSLGRRFLLIDTFSPYAVDEVGEQHEEHGESRYYAESVDVVRENFREWPRVEVVQGRIPEVLSTVAVDSVAYLHVDLNAVDAERASLEWCWPKLSAGAFVLLDDYGLGGPHEAQKAMADEFAASVDRGVLTLPTGQGLLIR